VGPNYVSGEKRLLTNYRGTVPGRGSLQDGVNRMKKAMRWQDRRIHMKIPNFGEHT
jgi:hypothetical protein